MSNQSISNNEHSVNLNELYQNELDGRGNYTYSQPATFSSFFENSVIFAYSISIKHPFSPTYISPAFESFGYNAEQWLDGSDLWIRTIYQSDLNIFLTEIDNAVQNKLNFDCEYRIVKKNGEICWVRNQATLVFAETNEPITLQGILVDITAQKNDMEHKLAMDKLREREEFLFSVTNSAKDAIVSSDNRGNIVFWNEAAANIFGYKESEIIGKPLTVLMPESYRKHHTNGIERYKQTGESRVIGKFVEVVGLRKDGLEFPLELSMGEWETTNGKFFIGIMRDLSERNAAQEALKENEEKYRELFENANDLIYTLDVKGNFTSLNKTGEQILGYQREEVQKMNILDVVAPEFHSLVRKKNKVQNLTNKPMTLELDVIAKEGNLVSLEISTRLIYRKDEVIGVQGIGRDITERKRIVAELKASESQYRLLSEGIMHQVWTATPDGLIDYINGRGMGYFALPCEKVLGEKWTEVVHPEDLQISIEKWNHSLKTGDFYKTEFRLRRFDGQYRWHRALGIAGKDSDGNIIKWFGTNTDIHDQKTAEEQLSYFAKHDVLTGLPNRFKFMNYLEQVTKRAEQKPEQCFAVFFLDIDRFKLFNDSFGHLVGDKLLVAFAERLESNVRFGDIIARLGGDEFTILLNTLSGSDEAISIANTLINSFLEPFNVNGNEVFTSASIGIVISDEVVRVPIEYLRDADTAMYRAKEAGKSCYEVFNTKMLTHNLNLLHTENDLRRAIERDEFRVFYQPIVSLETGEIHAFEALVRWQHPERGLVQPFEFIHIAEETGMIVPIGKWVLEEACRQTVEWQQHFPRSNPFLINVNLSSKQLMHPSLISQVKKALAISKLNPRYLELEVTESIVMENDKVAFAVLDELKEIGVSLSTDDFGTGFSSLSYLHKFPFDTLKIDHSFVSKMDANTKCAEIVSTILTLAQNLSLQVVAEGIETETQLRQLQLLGCNYGQGYLFSKPVIAREAEYFLSDKSNNFRFSVPPIFKPLNISVIEMEQ